MPRARKQPSLYVVVVADHQPGEDLVESGLANGQYAAFIGTDQAVVVDRAMKTVSSWGFRDGFERNISRVDSKPYRLLLGKLTGVVKPVSEYEVKPL